MRILLFIGLSAIAFLIIILVPYWAGKVIGIFAEEGFSLCWLAGLLNIVIIGLFVLCMANLLCIIWNWAM